MDTSSLILGLALGIVGAFGTGFLKKAGEDSYSWLKKKVSPKSTLSDEQQVILHIPNANETKLQSAEQIQPLKTISSSEVSFRDIESAIDAAPPMQRKNVANGYLGLKVQWDSYLRSADMQDDGKVNLRLSVDKNYRGRSVLCTVNAEDYRVLGILPTGTLIRVAGEIASATSCDVKLTKAKLQITHPN